MLAAMRWASSLGAPKVRGAAVAGRRPPPRHPSAGSEKQRQEATQRQAAEQHLPIGRCQPKQPAFANRVSDHRHARCETIRKIATTGDGGCSAGVTGGQKSERCRNAPHSADQYSEAIGLAR